MENIVSTEWLEERLSDPDVVVVDGSWHMPSENRDPRAEYLEKHIKRAVFFDLDTHSDRESELPHMMPSPQQFASEMGELGISDQDTIIVYDTKGLFSAARVWWMFKQFGAAKVFVLNGGLKAWEAAGLPTESGPVQRPRATFAISDEAPAIVDIREIRDGLAQKKPLSILDARGKGRYLGLEEEPRPGLRKGHIPGASNLPFTDLIKDGSLKPKEELAEILSRLGLDQNLPVIATCGSGVTAAIILLALSEVGIKDTRLYDGSWAEWGADPDLPIATAQ